MREIKYRCWVVRESEDDEEIMPYMGDMSEVESFKSPFAEHRKGNIILLQYTGLTDRNGKEVYEGDIVKGAHRSNEEWVQLQEVKYSKGCFMFGNWNAHEYFNKHTHIEIIGNIYENPELLEVSA